ncbi:histidine phosphatase family protein [Terribacillus saccharophilus]|uniref:histidine phosphatase family protein n=1 Tax=Terribacillus saccharophilus TaxID=361277 RepID=UPI000BA62B8C|nr:histidine phosphatase family protein [Terribacillus saccharophilus]PAF21617.1 histidine phosphatase family protein [Terribacillus saccharophilus]
MTTSIYMVRHGESPKEGNERTRGLTDKGKQDAIKIAGSLKEEMIEVFVSSPYTRAVETIRGLAEHAGKKVDEIEDLRERVFASGDTRISDKELLPLLKKSFADPNFSFTGGESNVACQKRAIAVLEGLLKIYQGSKIAIGTHGAVMTLMMGYYDSQYGLDFLLQSSKPDIYRMEFNGYKLIGVERLWMNPRKNGYST